MWVFGIMLLASTGWNADVQTFVTREECVATREALVSTGPSAPGYLFVTPCVKISDGPNQEEILSTLDLRN